VSLTIGRGDFLRCFGPSGSGKTTFLMILAASLPPSQGRLLMERARYHGRQAEDRSYGMVFQGLCLFPHMSVEANIASP